MSKECLDHNFQIPRKHICQYDFNSILTNFNGQGENIVNNSDDAQRYSETKDLTEKGKSDLSGLIKLRKENPNNPNIAYLNIYIVLTEKIISL